MVELSSSDRCSKEKPDRRPGAMKVRGRLMPESWGKVAVLVDRYKCRNEVIFFGGEPTCYLLEDTTIKPRAPTDITMYATAS